MPSETFRTLYLDPGEDFGWCVGRGTKLLAGGTTKMWACADDIWAELQRPQFDDRVGLTPFSDPSYARDGVADEELVGPIGRMVCEDWRLYPNKLRSLAWDQCRTARVIGALTFMCHVHQIPFVLQGANIKAAAQSAGAEELYWRPLRENRHQNDALQHFVFFTNVELMGVNLPVASGYGGEGDH